MEPVPEKKRQQIYIGKLPRSFNEEDLEKEFGRFGKHSDVVVKRGYAFMVLYIYLTRADLRQSAGR